MKVKVGGPIEMLSSIIVVLDDGGLDTNVDVNGGRRWQELRYVE